MRRPLLVVLDLAGTTIVDDDAVYQCFLRALRADALLFSIDEIHAVMGLSKPAAIARLLSTRSGRAPDPARVRRIHERFVAFALEHFGARGAVREVDGATYTLSALSAAGVKVAIDAGFARPIAEAVLARLGWVDRGLVHAVVSADEADAEGVRAAMRLTGVEDARRVARVGDNPRTLIQGTLAGCLWVVGVTYGSHRRHELVLRPHTHLVSRLPELLGVFGVDAREASGSGDRIRAW